MDPTCICAINVLRKCLTDLQHICTVFFEKYLAVCNGNNKPQCTDLSVFCRRFLY